MTEWGKAKARGKRQAEGVSHVLPLAELEENAKP